LVANPGPALIQVVALRDRDITGPQDGVAAPLHGSAAPAPGLTRAGERGTAAVLMAPMAAAIPAALRRRMARIAVLSASESATAPAHFGRGSMRRLPALDCASTAALESRLCSSIYRATCVSTRRSAEAPRKDEVNAATAGPVMR
jgi:hypothetical protein